MENIYEGIYQHLINQGIEEEVVTNFVNKMYDEQKYHEVEVLDEGILRGLGAAARFIGRLSKTRAGKASMFGTGAAGLGYAGYLADNPGNSKTDEPKTEQPKVVQTKDAPTPEPPKVADTAPATPENNTVADKTPSSAGKKINKVIDKVKKSNDDRKKELERIRGAAALATIGRSKNADKILTGRSTSKNVNSIVDKSYNRVLTGSPDDVRDRDVNARSGYDPRLKSERNRKKSERKGSK
jgi:hypothetical protein